MIPSKAEALHKFRISYGEALYELIKRGVKYSYPDYSEEDIDEQVADWIINAHQYYLDIGFSNLTKYNSLK